MVVVVWAESSTSVGQRSNTFWRGQEQLIKKAQGAARPQLAALLQHGGRRQGLPGQRYAQKDAEKPRVSYMVSLLLKSCPTT